MARKRKGDKQLAEGLEVEGFVIAGTPAAFDALDPRLAESPYCVRCGSPIKNVFLTSKGPMGGDCLATLTGDSSTRRLARKLIGKLDRVMGYREVTGLKVEQSRSWRSDYWIRAVCIDRRNYDSWTGRYGTRTELLGSVTTEQLPVALAIVANEAELRGLDLTVPEGL